MEKVLQGLRPYSADDIDSLCSLLAEANAWPPPSPPTPQDLLNRWKHWDLHPEQDINILPGPGGEIIASSLSAVSRRDTHRVSLEIAVHPSYRRRGIGSALYSLIEARAHELGATHLTSPVYRSPDIDKEASVRFLEKRGFRCTSSYWRLRIDDIVKTEPADWPSGIVCRGFRPTQDDAARWAHLINVAFGEAASAEMVLAQVAELESSPQGYFFAVDAETRLEIGTSRARLDNIGGERLGYIGTVGVLPEYRGRGIAQALIRETLLYLVAQGMSSATLFVEGGNTPALALYDKLGWYPVYRTDHYWKTLTVTSQVEPHQ